MTRTRWRVLAAGAALLALMAQPLVAAAHEGEHHKEEHDDPVEVVEPLRARTADAALIARATDLETGQVLDLLGEQDRFGDLLVQLADAYPDTYTSGIAPHEPGAPGLVRFAGEVPDKARALAERAEVAVEFEGDAPASARELQARSQRVHDALLERGVKRVATAVLPDGVILATIPDREEVDLPRDLAEGVRVQTTEGPVAVDEHTRGGAWVRDDGVRECTSGFSVETAGGTRGVTTAGHCTGIDEYEQPSDGPRLLADPPAAARRHLGRRGVEDVAALGAGGVLRDRDAGPGRDLDRALVGHRGERLGVRVRALVELSIVRPGVRHVRHGHDRGRHGELPDRDGRRLDHRWRQRRSVVVRHRGLRHPQR